MKTFIISIALFSALITGCASTTEKISEGTKSLAESAADAANTASDTAKDAAETAADKAAEAKDAVAGLAPNVVQVAATQGQFTTLVTAIRAANLVEALEGDGPFTVFAPTDDAFAKLPPGTVKELLEDTDKLAKILKYHVVAGEVMAADVGTLTEAETLEGNKFTIDATDGVMLNGKVKVTATDIKARNGVIHVIDTVMMPPM